MRFLKGTKCFVIIDEADHLTLNALQAVRNLNDEANVGIVLVGNNKLYQQMISGVRGYEFDQIRTRIFLKPQVLNDYTLDELAHIFPECDEKILAVLHKTATKESLREAKKLYNFCIDYTASQGIKLTERTMLKLMETIYEEKQMADIIISIIPQTKNPPIFDDYKLVVDVGYKSLTIRLSKKDACEVAIVLSQVLELVDDNIVKFGTYVGNWVCEEFIAAYRRKQEKEAAVTTNNNRHTKNKVSSCTPLNMMFHRKTLQ